jgi:GMP synthase (glutamine-hydrolysing)
MIARRPHRSYDFRVRRIVILRCGDAVKEVAARRGEFASWIQAGVGDVWNGAWHEHDLRGEAAPPPARDGAAFILTGSSSNVTERAPWMLRAEGYVRDLAGAGVPVLGICFGHQLIAKALGGEVEKNPRGREIGTVPVTKTADDRLFDALPDPFAANATHVESVTRLPEGARVLAKTERDPVAAFAIGERVRCVQFHPEIDGDAMRGYIAARAHLMRAEGLDPEAALAGAGDANGKDVLRAFVARFVAR